MSEASKSTPWSWRRRAFVGISTLLLLITVVALTIISTNAGRVKLAHLALRYTLPTNIAITIEDLSSPDFGVWAARSLEVTLDDKDIVKATTIAVSFSPKSIWRLRPVIHNVSIHTLRVSPPEQKTTQTHASNPLAQLERIPTLFLENFTIAQWDPTPFHLNSSLLRDPLSIRGSAQASSTIQWDISLSNLNAGYQLTTKGNYDGYDELDLSLSLNSREQSVLSQMLATADEDVRLALTANLRMENTRFFVNESNLEVGIGDYQLRAHTQGMYQLSPALWRGRSIIEFEKGRMVADGSVDATGWDYAVQFNDIPLDFITLWATAFPGGLASGEGRWRGPYNDPAFFGSTLAKTTIKGDAIQLQAEGRFGITSLSVTEAVLDWRNAHIDLQGDFNYLSLQTHADVLIKNLDYTHLTPWINDWPSDFTFDHLNATGHINGDITRPSINAKIDGQAQLKNHALTWQCHCQFADNNLTVNPLNIDSPLGHAAATGRWNPAKNTLNLNLEFKEINEITLNAFTKVPSGLFFQGDGHVTLQGPIDHLTFTSQSQWRGRYQSAEFTLYSLADGTPEKLDRLELSLAQSNDQSVLRLSGKADKQSAHLKMFLDQLPAQWMGSWYRGKTFGEVHVNGPWQNPVIEGTIENHSLVYDNQKEENVNSIVVGTLSTLDSELKLDAHFQYDDTQMGTAEGVLDVPALMAYIMTGASIPRMEINADTQLKNLPNGLDSDIHQLAGHLSTQLVMEDFPNIRTHGLVQLNDGFYEHTISQNRVENIQCQLAFNGHTIDINTCRGSDGNKGKYDLSGDVTLPQGVNPSAVNVKLDVRNTTLYQSDSIEGEVSGELNVQGSFSSLGIKGNFDVNPFTALLGELNTSNIPHLNVTEFRSSEHEDIVEAPSTALPDIHYDITIKADNQAIMRGYGIEAELKGNLNIHGNQKSVQVDGHLQTVRGKAEIFGKKFTIQNGDLTFFNNAYTFLVNADYSKRDTQVQAEIKGDQGRIQLSLSSTPVMPEDQILAFLMFGKSVQNTSPLEAIQLAAALQKLQGGEPFFDPIGTARDILAVDTLSIDTEENDSGERGVNVGVGKYINDKVYVELERISDSNDSQPWRGHIEIELTPILTLESSTGGKTGIEGAKLKWKRNY